MTPKIRSQKPYPDTFAETMNMIMDHFCFNPSRMILEAKPEEETKLQYAIRCRRAECLATLATISLAYNQAKKYMLEQQLLRVEQEIDTANERIKERGPLRTEVNLQCHHPDCIAIITEDNPRSIYEGLRGCEECHADRFSEQMEWDRQEELEDECPGCDYCDPDMTPEDIERHYDDEHECGPDDEPITLGQAFADAGLK